mgnify:CR=1 FL=1
MRGAYKVIIPAAIFSLLTAGCRDTYESLVKKFAEELGFSEKAAKVLVVGADRLLFSNETDRSYEFNYSGITVYDIKDNVDNNLNSVRALLARNDKIGELLRDDMEYENKRWTWLSRRVSKKIVRNEIRRIVYGEEISIDKLDVDEKYRFDPYIVLPSKYLKKGIGWEPELIKDARDKGLIDIDRAYIESIALWGINSCVFCWDIDDKDDFDYFEFYRLVNEKDKTVVEEYPFLRLIRSVKHRDKFAGVIDYDMPGYEDYGEPDEVIEIDENFYGTNSLRGFLSSILWEVMYRIYKEYTSWKYSSDINDEIDSSVVDIVRSGSIAFDKYEINWDGWKVNMPEEWEKEHSYDVVMFDKKNESILWVARVYNMVEITRDEGFRIRNKVIHGDIYEYYRVSDKLKGKNILSVRVRKIKLLPFLPLFERSYISLKFEKNGKIIKKIYNLTDLIEKEPFRIDFDNLEEGERWAIIDMNGDGIYESLYRMSNMVKLDPVDEFNIVK